MKHLNRSIMEDYEIISSAPQRLCGVQLGDNAPLLGVADRLLDDANRAGANVGLALVQPEDSGFAKALSEQDGMYTMFIRGDLNEKEIRREQVVQSILKALEPASDDEALMALARSSEIRFLLMSEDETGEFARQNAICAALAARFLVERRRAGLSGLAVIVCGDSEKCAERMRERIAQVAAGWNEAGFGEWLAQCRFFPSLLEGMAARSSAEEAARLCGEMNYADAMIHIAEPYARWTIQADEAFREEFPWEGDIAFVDDLASALNKKHRLFDAGLFVLTALGALHGNDTLADCMKDEPLRERLGHALMDEILPFVPMSREEASAYVIACCERWENPLNDNWLFEAGSGLLRRFQVGVLPAMRAYAEENFAAPELLSLALAAAMLIYAGVREADGRFMIELGDVPAVVHDDPEALGAFAKLSPDMPSDSLAYAVLADRTLWHGADLREIDGLEESMTRNMAMVASMLAEKEE